MTSELHTFQPWPKIPRLFRKFIITEKVDGTNAAVVVTEEGDVLAQSRTRFLTPDNDNFGFAAWVKEHEDELREGLGVGRHFGEWYGKGIQRGYGLDEKRFALFNTTRWLVPDLEGREFVDSIAPACCQVVPVLWAGDRFDTAYVEEAMDYLRAAGSVIAPGFQNPEGVVVYHEAANKTFKALLENDDEPKNKKESK